MAANSKRITWLLLAACVLLASCFSRPPLMTYETYEQIKIGTPVAKIRDEVGKPYAIHHKEDGTDEYEYIERIDAGTNLIAENHYFLIVKDGVVIGKYITRERLPAYDLIYQEEPNYRGSSN